MFPRAGSPRCLQQYETARQRENLAVMGAVDALHRLYSSKLPPIVLLRAIGLSAVNTLAPLKVRGPEPGENSLHWKANMLPLFSIMI